MAFYQVWPKFDLGLTNFSHISPFLLGWPIFWPLSMVLGIHTNFWAIPSPNGLFLAMEHPVVQLSFPTTPRAHLVIQGYTWSSYGTICHLKWSLGALGYVLGTLGAIGCPELPLRPRLTFILYSKPHNFCVWALIFYPSVLWIHLIVVKKLTYHIHLFFNFLRGHPYISPLLGHALRVFSSVFFDTTL